MYRLYKIKITAEQVGGVSIEADGSIVSNKPDVSDIYYVCANKDEYAKNRARQQFSIDHPINDSYVSGAYILEIKSNILL